MSANINSYSSNMGMMVFIKKETAHTYIEKCTHINAYTPIGTYSTRDKSSTICTELKDIEPEVGCACMWWQRVTTNAAFRCIQCTNFFVERFFFFLACTYAVDFIVAQLHNLCKYFAGKKKKCTNDSREKLQAGKQTYYIRIQCDGR